MIGKGLCWLKQCAYDLGTRFAVPPPDVPSYLYLTFTGAPAGVSDPNDVADWNSYLNFSDTSNNAGSFSAVAWDGFNAILTGYDRVNIQIPNTSGLATSTELEYVYDYWLLHTIRPNGLAGATNLVYLESPTLEVVLNRAFDNTNITDLYAPNLKTLGATAGDNNVFQNITSAVCNVTCHSTLATNNGGSPDGDLQFLISNFPASVIICGNTQINP